MKNIFTKWRSDIQTIFIMIVAIVVIMLLVYDLKGMYPFGKEIIAWGDMGEQTIPENFYYLWDMLHGKGNAFFSWKVGLGINIAGAASEQAFFSPLNLFLLLTTRDNLINFVNIMVIIKMIGIAVSMYIYLRIYQVDMRIKLAGSMIYTFSAACLIHYQIIFVMDAAFLLPLLMTGMRLSLIHI